MNTFLNRKIVFPLIAFLFSSGLLAAEVINPFQAEYVVTYLGLNVGVTKQIFTIDSNYRYRFTQIADATVPGISFHTEETSEGIWKNGEIRPLLYKFTKEGNALATVKSHFDWNNQRVVYQQKGESGVQKLLPGTLDKLSCQLALRQALINQKDHFRCPFIDGKKYKQYFFSVRGTRLIHSPLGKFNVLEVEQRKPTATKPSSLFWVSPKDNYLLIKFSYLKDRKSPSTATLRKIR